MYLHFYFLAENAVTIKNKIKKYKILCMERTCIMHKGRLRKRLKIRAKGLCPSSICEEPGTSQHVALLMRVTFLIFYFINSHNHIANNIITIHRLPKQLLSC